MRKICTTTILLLALTPLAGCASFNSTMKRMTGLTDDTVLPGQREDVLPPDQQQAKDPNVMKNRKSACGADNSSCAQSTTTATSQTSQTSAQKTTQ